MERDEENISLTDTIQYNREDQPLIKLNYELKLNTGIDENLSNILKRTKRDEHDGLNI